MVSFFASVSVCCSIDVDDVDDDLELIVVEKVTVTEVNHGSD